MKRIIAFITLILLLFTLCGCDFIDELRKSYAHRLDDGNIKYDDSTYVCYPNAFVQSRGMDGADVIGICSDGEPVLWAYFVDDIRHYREDYCYVNENRTVLFTDLDKKFYIREDVYGELKKELEEFENGECIIVFRHFEKQKVFSAEDSKILFEALKQPTPELEIIPGAVTSHADSLYMYSLNGGNFSVTLYSKVAYFEGNYYIDIIPSDGGYQLTGRAAELVKEMLDLY